MKEQIFNIFLIIEDKFITEIGVAIHEIEGTDEQKVEYLNEHIESDVKICTRFKLPEIFKTKDNGKEFTALSYERYREMVHSGTDGILFEQIYTYYKATDTPLRCVTTVVDGKITIDDIDTIKNDNPQMLKEFYEVMQPDYIDQYFSDKEFRFSDLINDDFFEGIRTTFQKGLYVSSIKLMMSFIDTAAFLEFGDVPGNFNSWLDTYSEIHKMNITSSELWEFRNSILHMTNINSRKHLNGKVERVRFYVSEENLSHLKRSDTYKYFNYKELINVIAHSIAKWGETYSLNRNKIDEFIMRYDQIISDKRYSYIKIN